MSSVDDDDVRALLDAELEAYRSVIPAHLFERFREALYARAEVDPTLASLLEALRHARPRLQASGVEARPEAEPEVSPEPRRRGDGVA